MTGDGGTLDAWIASYLAALRAAGAAQTTIATRSRTLALFAQWCRDHGVTHGAELTTGHAVGFQRWLHTRTTRSGAVWSILSQRGALSDLRAFGAWCVRAGRSSVDPMRGIELPRVPRSLPAEPLTRDQVERLLAHPDATTPLGLRDRAILEVLYAVGVHHREIAAAEIVHYARETALLTVPPLESRRERVVPIGERAAWWLARYLDHARPFLATRSVVAATRLFLSQLGRALGASDVALVLAKHVRGSGIAPGRRVSSLRPTTAAHLLDGGVDLRFLAALFGHRDLQGVQKYAQVAARRLKAVHARFHPAEQPRTPAT